MNLGLAIHEMEVAAAGWVRRFNEIVFVKHLLKVMTKMKMRKGGWEGWAEESEEGKERDGDYILSVWNRFGGQGSPPLNHSIKPYKTEFKERGHKSKC